MLKSVRHISVKDEDNMKGLYVPIEGRTRYVSPSFNDKSVYYSTIQAAIDASASGETVVIHNGLYEEDLVLADGVNLYFEVGAIVKPPSSGRADYHIDLDGVTANIYGYGEFLFLGGSTGSQYHIAVRNDANLYIQCKRIDYDTGAEPAHTGIHIEGGCTVTLDISEYCRQIEVDGGVGYEIVNLNGWVENLILLDSIAADLRGVLNTGSLGTIDIDYPNATAQLFRYQINVLRRHVSSYTSRIAGKARLHITMNEWVHTPDVAGEARFNLEDEADLLFSGTCLSNIDDLAANSGPFFHLVSDQVTLVLKDTVMVTDDTYSITAVLPSTVYRAYATYSNKVTDANVSAFGGLNITQNPNVYA